MAKQAFLINPRKRKAKARRVVRYPKGFAFNPRKKTSRRTGASRKSVPQWVRDKGFASWGAYMASIRPNSGGSQVAKRRRRRASARRNPPATTTRRRRRRSYRRNPPVAYAANPRRRHRRSYRHNPPNLSPRGIVKTVTNAGMNAVGVLSGKIAARVGRGKIGIAGGTPVGMLTEVGIGIGGGIVARKVSPRFAEMFITGALVSVIEPLAKGFLPASVGGALGDEDSLIAGESLAGYLNGGVGSYDQDQAQGMAGYELAEA